MTPSSHFIVGESGDAGSRPPRLLDQVRAAIRARHYSRSTEKAYIGWIRRYILFHRKRHPVAMGEPEISQFLSDLATRGRVSASTQNQALSSVLFLYREVLKLEVKWVEGVVRAKRPVRLPVVLTRQEVATILQLHRGTQQITASLMYGAGLRLMECVRLRVKDLEMTKNEITVRDGKGRKDRVTVLPTRLKRPLAEHLRNVRQQHEEDLRNGGGSVEVPFAIARKYPRAPWEWGWQWVFPATRSHVDPETGWRRRHHLHESVLQRSMRDAVLRAGMTKPASCHTLRHSFATHLLQGIAFLPCHPEGTEAAAGGVS